MKIDFRFCIKLSLVLVYLVIIAGSVVRMTGSGMGCPDWPKCFGYLIPPTDRSQLDWKSYHQYKRGQIIIENDVLLVANSDFITSEEFTEKNWFIYTKHDYAEFNVGKTYTEYINRLLGALAGLVTLVMLLMSIRYFRSRSILFLLSLVVVLLMGFQGWLGKVVVDSNLLPWKVSIHMIVALVIVLFLVNLLAKTSSLKASIIPSGKPWINRLLLVGFIILLIQIGLGLQVRQVVDVQINEGYLLGDITLKRNTPKAYFQHAGLGFAFLLLNLILLYQFLKAGNIPRIINIIILLIGLEVILGIILYHFNFPFSSQPLHLLIASLLFGFYSFLLLNKSNECQSEQNVSR